LATAVSAWQAFRATRAEAAAQQGRIRALAAEREAQKDRNRALAAERVAKEQTERALKAEQAAVDELETMRTVARLKDATVYIKKKIAGKTFASATGFVIEVHGENVILLTNGHVVEVDVSDVPTTLAPEESNPEESNVELEVVFRSGQGAQKEKSYPAQLMAADRSGDIATDLAFLLVKGVQEAPSPINVLTKSDTTEGTAYTGAGFPFGEINVSRSHPGITITRGVIASLVKDEHGHVNLFQVNSSRQPGDAGGPIVAEKTGKFIGVVVTKKGAVDHIGLVIPAEQVRETLAGRIGALDLTVNAIQKDSADLQIKAEIVDPMGTGVRDVVILAVAASAGTISPNGDGSWPPLPNSKPVELKRNPNAPSASGRVKVALSGEGAAARKILIQAAKKDVFSTLVYFRPKEFDLPEKPGRIRPAGILERIVRNARRESFEMLRTFVDPSNDCKLVKDEEGMKIKIEVPGDKVHTLATEAMTRVDKTKTLHNAPMALTEVEGDFVAMVLVTGDMSPGARLPQDRQGNDLPFTFNGAGLVLYQDKDNFIRLERTAGVAVDDLQSIHQVLVEIVKDGKRLDTTDVYWPLPEGNVQLFMIRRNGKVRFQFRPGDSDATFSAPEFDLILPSKVSVGLSASNISAKPFTATFENFAVLNDVSVIDQQFGDSKRK
jgi:regulation of enolase protein 1 (concanavalin A-like superfamily)